MLNGRLESEPSDVVFAKNSTFVTVPSLSLPEASMIKVAGAEKLAPLSGLVMSQAWLRVARVLTVTFTTADVAERPRLSTATAVRAWLPMARLAVTV